MNYLSIMLHILFLCVATHAFDCVSTRSDGACYLNIPGGGSLQNPSLGPDGNLLVYTRWARSYNKGASNICVYNLANGSQKCIASGVNLPGVGIWRKDENSGSYSIIYSGEGSKGVDAALSTNLNTLKTSQLSNNPGKQAWEPTFSPNGKYIVYEQHGANEDNEYDGVIVTHPIASNKYTEITPRTWLCKQPYWSPAGNQIIFQRASKASESAKIDIYSVLIDSDGKTSTLPNKILSDASDVTFSANGEWLIYSNEKTEGIWAAKVANTSYTTRLSTPPKKHYDGACAASFDGQYILFETVDSLEPESGNKFARICIKRATPK